MKGRNGIATSIAIVCVILLAAGLGCVDQRAAVSQDAQRMQGEAAAPPPVEQATEATPEAAAGPKNLYAAAVAPLESGECARCHLSQYNRLRDAGAKHQAVACTDCHDVFHAYNPVKNNYAEIMPKCASCHSDPHGPDKAVQTCASCHSDPHMPLSSMPNPSGMEAQCRICHGVVAKSLTDHPSKHTTTQCSACHSEKHGRIPTCTECHDNHSPMVAMLTPECMACHPVHTPLAINYGNTASDNPVCAGCHDVPFDQLKARQTKHSPLACAECHPRHKALMACTECHGQPHNPGIHQKYPKCGDCHGIAHDLRK